MPRDGRLIVVVSKQMQGEPRFQVTWGVRTQQIFGKDVDGWKPGDTVEMGPGTPGDPLRAWRVPAPDRGRDGNAGQQSRVPARAKMPCSAVTVPLPTLTGEQAMVDAGKLKRQAVAHG
jgi:NADPH:quinone reductase-like Zn-dependent oxidoreductase